jgi:hypothetical protein
MWDDATGRGDASRYFHQDAFIIASQRRGDLWQSSDSCQGRCSARDKTRGGRTSVTVVIIFYWRPLGVVFTIVRFQLPKGTRWHRTRAITYSMWSRRFTLRKRTADRHKCESLANVFLSLDAFYVVKGVSGLHRRRDHHSVLGWTGAVLRRHQHRHLGHGRNGGL